MEIEEFLKIPLNYATAIEKLYLRAGDAQLAYLPENELDKLEGIFKNKRHHANNYALLVGDGKWQFYSLTRKEKIKKGKKREIFYPSRIEDVIVYQTLYEGLQGALSPLFSPSLYSFQKNKSHFQQVKDLLSFLIEYRSRVQEPTQRGLYLFKMDIHSYFNSIPTHQDALLWKKLLGALKIRCEKSWQMIKQAICPTFLNSSQEPIPCEGLPIGHSLSCIIANFYLTELDRQLTAVNSNFYARYCDDIVFVSEDFLVVRDTLKRLQSYLLEHGLKLNPKKTEMLYWNGAGRASPIEGFEGKESFTLLGHRLHFRATISFPPSKMRKILKEMTKRIRRTNQLLEELPLQEKGRSLCQMVNSMFNPDSPFLIPSVKMLNKMTDSAQKKQLCFLTALNIAGGLTKTKGVRAFRTIAPKTIFNDWKLFKWKN